MVVSRGEVCASLDWRRDGVARRRHLVQNFDEKARAENKPRSAGERRYFEPRLPLVRGRCHRPARPHPPDSRPNSHLGRPRARMSIPDAPFSAAPSAPGRYPPAGRGHDEVPGASRLVLAPAAPRAKRKCASIYADLVPGSNITSRLEAGEFALPEGPRVFTRATTRVPKLAPDPGARPARRPPAATPRVSRREDDAAAVADSLSSLRSASFNRHAPFSRDDFAVPRGDAGPVQRPEAYVGRRLLLRSADAARANGPFDPHPHVIVAYRADLALHVARKEPLSRRRRGDADDDVHQPRERDGDDEDDDEETLVDLTHPALGHAWISDASSDASFEATSVATARARAPRAWIEGDAGDPPSLGVAFAAQRTPVSFDVFARLPPGFAPHDVDVTAETMEDARATAPVTRVFIVGRAASASGRGGFDVSVSAPRVAVALEDVRAAATPSGEFCVTCPIAAAENVDEDEDEDEDGVLGGREGAEV